MSNEYLAQEQLDIICLHSFNNIGRIKREQADQEISYAASDKRSYWNSLKHYYADHGADD